MDSWRSSQHGAKGAVFFGIQPQGPTSLQGGGSAPNQLECVFQPVVWALLLVLGVASGGTGRTLAT